jgi:metallophosphoesterase superfamily enzyme
MAGTRHAAAEFRPGLWLDTRRALWVAECRLLVVADLHWGYAISHRSSGHLFPLWGDEVIGEVLTSLLADYAPKEMIWLGDSVHAAAGRTAAEHFLDRAGLPSVTVIAGNHDRNWARATAAEVSRGSFHFHHGDALANVPEGCTEIVGHFHPAVSISDGAGTRLKLPALVDSPRRIILPALSPWSGGTLWAPAGANERLWVVAAKRVFLLPPRQPGGNRSDCRD